MLPPFLEKPLNILDYSLSSVWRHKGKNISVMAVFASVIFLLSSFQMVTRALTEKAAAVLAYAPEITVQRMSAGRQDHLPIAYQQHLASIFGIQKAVPRVWGYYFDETHLANYTILGLDTSAMPEGGRLSLTLAQGRFPNPGAGEEVVVGRGVYKLLALEGRDLFSLFRPDLSLQPLRIVGTFGNETDLLTDDLIVMNTASARELFGIAEGQATDLAVSIANPAEVETIARKIAKELPDTRVVTRQQVQKTYQVVFGWRSGFGSICLLAALFAFVILAWDKASGLSPEERREIAILKILGWETTDILAVRFWESFWISGLAFIIGCTAGFLHVAYFEAALFRPVMIGWSVVYPPFTLLPSITFADLLLIFSFSVLPYLAATIIPAWRGATVPPDAAIK
jgi:ABC-type lipoprotein release transport system permease subunit